MLNAALEAGDLRPGDTVVESSSGNLGVALAQLCGWHGLDFVCVVDPKTNPDNIRIIEAYGGRVHPVRAAAPGEGGWLEARQRAVRDLVSQNPRAWTSDQYGNVNNPAAHAEGTMQEILDTLGEEPAVLLVATSTTGTLQGCQQRLASAGASTRVIAVDAVGSVLFGGAEADRLLPGFGASVVPDLATTARPDGVVRVDDLDCVIGCRRVARAERVLVGASAGGVAEALGPILHTMADNAVVAMVMHDGGERYLDTVFNDDWVAAELDCDRAGLEAYLDAPPRVA
jgi:cysteine synthase A